jgi:hypothetical protein
MKRRKLGLWIGVILISMLSTPNAGVAQDEGAQVTLRIFFGRPDPVWTLTTSESQALWRILETLPPEEASKIPENLAFYPSFEIRMGENTVYVNYVSVGQKVAFGHSGYVELLPGPRWLNDPNNALAIWLLGTAGETLEPDLVVWLWTELANQSNPNAVIQ